MSTLLQIDNRAQLQALYMSLITRQDRFDEFKDLLASYPDLPSEGDVETEEAILAREALNDRVREWSRIPGGGLSAQQITMLRDMLVTHRLFLAISPWKEANSY